LPSIVRNSTGNNLAAADRRAGTCTAMSANMPTDSAQRSGEYSDGERDLRDDPRADPRMVAALAAFGFDHAQPPSLVSASSPHDDLLAYVAAVEEGFRCGVRCAVQRAATDRRRQPGNHDDRRSRRQRDHARYPSPNGVECSDASRRRAIPRRPRGHSQRAERELHAVAR
jgi:hypothetical protein